MWDGDCGFCQNSLEWLKKQNLQGNIEYVSFHEDSVKKWRETIGEESLKKSMFVVKNQTELFSRADGFRILLSLSIKWKWLSFLMGLPLIKQCCNFGYQIIANNRYRFGKHSCRLN